MAIFGLSEQELKEREKEVLGKEKSVEEKTGRLAIREAHIEGTEEELTKRTAGIDARAKQIAEKLADLNRREESVAAREQEADAGFPTREAEFLGWKQEREQALLEREQSIHDKEQMILESESEVGLARQQHEQERKALDEDRKRHTTAAEDRERQIVEREEQCREREEQLTELDRSAQKERRHLQEEEEKRQDAETDLQSRIEAIELREQEYQQRIHADEQRRRELAEQATHAAGERERLNEDIKLQFDQRSAELDEGFKRLEKERAAQEQWAERLRQQQRQVESGLAEHRASLEVLYHEQRESLDALTEELEVKRTELAERERSVLAGETKAKAGFAAKNEEALAELRRKTEGIRLQNEQLTQELEQRRTRSFAELEEALEQERHKRTEALGKSIGAKREELANQEQELEHLKEEELKRIADLAAQQEATKASQVELDSRIQATEAQRERLEERASELAMAQVTDLEKKLDAARARALRLEDALAEREGRVRGLEETELRFGEQTSDEILQELDDLRKAKARLVEELTDRPTHERLKDLEIQLTDTDLLKSKVIELQGAWAIAKKQAMDNRMGVVELEAQREQYEIEKNRADVMRKQVDQLIGEIDRLTGLQERATAKIEKRREAIQTPMGSFDPDRNTVEPESELAWLDSIHDGCDASGYQFPGRLVESFHTALKAEDWSPLAVLAGVSGTGKTQLPNLYSRFGGMNFLSVPVQPNWDSPSSLLGFFNAIDNSFNATNLLRALDQFSRPVEDGDGMQDRILLVLLDEMNLAHVELYLSDFLSLWELRRGADEIPPVYLDLGAGADRYELSVDRNVLWCGTMNQDETTKSLSDKVIDRGSVLYFPRPDSLVSRSKPDLAPPAEALSLDTWRSWIRTSDQLPEAAISQVADYRGVIEAINKHLESAGRAMGHRLWQTVESYIANHPRVIQAADAGDDDAMSSALRLAFADQVVMKVMPKLRGIETTGRQKSHCLDPILAVLAEQSLGLEDDFNLACNSHFGMFSWASAKYLSEAR